MAVFLHLHDSGLTVKPQNSLKHGDLLIILDPNDYGKSCLVDSRDFGKASESFARLYSSSQAESQGCASEQGLTALLLFSSTGSTPEFHPVPSIAHAPTSHRRSNYRSSRKLGAKGPEECGSNSSLTQKT